MDHNNWRANPSKAEPAPDPNDWRSHLQPDSRGRIVNKIMETLKRHLPCQDGVNELRKIAVRFEENFYAAATSQPDYLRKITLKLLTMETKSQTNNTSSLPTNSGGNSSQPQPQSQQQKLMPQMQSQPAQMQMGMQQRLQASGQPPSALLQQQNAMDQQKQMYQTQRALPETSSTSLDSTAQAGQASGGDWQEEVYQKIKAMKDMYCPEITDLYQKITRKLQQHESHPQQPKSEQLERAKKFKIMLERMISFFKIPKENVQPTFKENLGSYEKKIISFLNTNGPRKPTNQIQMQHSMQSQIYRAQTRENQMNPQLQPMNSQQSASLHSTAETGQASGSDWQEEVYQKIKAMKDMYSPELTDLYQKIAGKLQQHESHPQQPKSEQLEKLKPFKIMLERMISFLEVPKENVQPTFKEKLDSNEKQIISLLNTNRSRKPGNQTQMQHSMQSRITQARTHENQMNQPMILQDSIATQQSGMTRLETTATSGIKRRRLEGEIGELAAEIIKLKKVKSLLVEECADSRIEVRQLSEEIVRLKNSSLEEKAVLEGKITELLADVAELKREGSSMKGSPFFHFL